MKAAPLRKAIVDWAKAAYPGIRIIRSSGNGIRPVLPYIQYKILSGGIRGREEKSYSDAQGVSNIFTSKSATISLQGFGDDAEEILETLQDSLLLETTRAYFAALNLGIWDFNGGISEIPQLVSNVIERRWLFEFVIGHTDTITENTGYIETVNDIFADSEINQPE